MKLIKTLLFSFSLILILPLTVLAQETTATPTPTPLVETVDPEDVPQPGTFGDWFLQVRQRVELAFARSDAARVRLEEKFAARLAAQMEKLQALPDTHPRKAELIQRLEEILKKGLVQIAGRAEILATFPFNNQKVAGCKVLDGKISKGTTLTLMRGDKEIGKAKAVTMKKLKQEIPAASAGEEFGVILSPQLDFAVGDVLLSAT